MKRKLLFTILAVVAVALLPTTATGQKFFFHHHKAPAAAEQTKAAYKYTAFAGYGYTSLNNLDQSRNGLMGVNLSLTRNLGRFFGVTADGGSYFKPYNSVNPGNPVVDMFFLGPEVHAPLFGKTSGFFRALLGGEHLSTDSTIPPTTPNISFAGGVGGGLDYRLSHRIGLRISGDDIESSFNANANAGVCPPSADCSPHKTRSSRVDFGFTYKF